MKAVQILFIALRLFLGGFMIYGGIQKFQKPIPAPVEVVEKAEKFKDPAKESTLQKILYISGSKQTGYFWQLLGICELLFGLLLVIQYTSFVGALFLLPITLNIFLFHIFLESDEISELLQTCALFGVNIALILKESSQWKHLLWIKPI
ncbi:DoxX family membrane protein [Flagellimonas allohymeniacidonis]|uniref:DoxX family membrane protein n=1 Tax=Flagellimonas allohymeniacidonis TaxID=2517819 RepID=A0A4Q8QIA8_9FLAO|nr:DoxX family membrane protein [Allomuricauda hymeniacidonis]TAI48129.1 DoxX family membrane protein [Allomuricauda hymeniacidonis]